MPLFEYKAVAPTGETVQGTMEAASLDMVVLKLQEAGNIPLQAKDRVGEGEEHCQRVGQQNGAHGLDPEVGRPKPAGRGALLVKGDGERLVEEAGRAARGAAMRTTVAAG